MTTPVTIIMIEDDDGHARLIARARRECGFVVVSIFVNPLQFGDPEDIAHYPRPLERDLAVCAETGAAMLMTAASVIIARRSRLISSLARPNQTDCTLRA